jgi:glutathione S-transferase
MIGIYYGTRADRIAASSTALAAGLVALGSRLGASAWLVGTGPTLAEAAVVPLYVRIGGLQRLGFDVAVDRRVVAHAERVADLPGGRAVTWSSTQTDEFVSRVERYREQRGATGGSTAGG